MWLHDQGAGEPAASLGHPDLHVAQDGRVVCEQRQRLDAQTRAVPRVGRLLQSNQRRKVPLHSPTQGEVAASQQAALRHSVKPPSEKIAEPVV